VLFGKKHTSSDSLSLTALTWQRFRKNKLALFGLSTIALACVISILGYLITPDDTPYANDQKPELRIREPGFSIRLLLVTRNDYSNSTSVFSKMLFGQTARHTSYSAYTHRFSGPDVLIEEYTGNTPNNGTVTRMNLATVIYGVPASKTKYDSLAGTLAFFDEETHTSVVKPVTGLREQVLNNHLINRTYWLGTDILGRDMLSRLLIGTRISLSVGLISVVISVFIGILLGALAGYYRGRIDTLIMWFINVVWSIPTILLVIAITLVLGKGITQVFIAVGLTMWVDVARQVRGQILSIREKEFVEAGRALGYTNGRIIFKHILPNVMGPVIVVAAGNFATAILTEAGLSFLGLGAQPPIPSWGEMTNAHHGYILMDKAYLAFIPGMAIMLLVLSFMLVGNGLRDAMDTRGGNDKPIANV